MTERLSHIYKTYSLYQINPQINCYKLWTELVKHYSRRVCECVLAEDEIYTEVDRVKQIALPKLVDLI